MTANRFPALLVRGVLVIACLAVMSFDMVTQAHAAHKRGRSTVWLVFFSTKDCPNCKAVKRLLRDLKKDYPIKIKAFNIEKKSHYRLFERLEAIHTTGKFSVPLILVGDSILIGEDTIVAQLESIVQRLAYAGGAGLPYLGPGFNTTSHARRPAKQATRTNASRCDCEKKGRPPSIGEELGKIKRFVDGLL
jgi:glutaredoxin